MSIYGLCVPGNMDSPLCKRKRTSAADSPDSHSSGASQSSAASTLYSSDSASSAGQLFGAKTREKTDSKCERHLRLHSAQFCIPAVIMLSILRSVAIYEAETVRVRGDNQQNYFCTYTEHPPAGGMRGFGDRDLSPSPVQGV